VTGSASSADRSSRARATPLRRLRLVFSLVIAGAAASLAAGQQMAPAPPGSLTISLADYRTRLQTLSELVAACRAATTSANCHGDQVGPDVVIALPSGNRPVGFGWLRDLLEEAAKNNAKNKPAPPDKPATNHSAVPGAKPPYIVSIANADYVPPTLQQRLENAGQRLAADEQFAAQASGEHSTPGSPQRAALAAILAAGEYHTAIAKRSLRDRILEKIANWIDKFFGKLVEAGSRSKWIGITAEIGFVLLVCVAVVWFLIRLERQSRFAPTAIGSGIGAGAASSRDWQLWLEDARQAASRAAWRDAIHLLYWASISRLESSGLWPADRARTPREYLALLAQDNPQHSSLSVLTRSFERTWYAGREAGVADYQQAEELAAQLGAKSSGGTVLR
jgi:uncharacterized protein DUF4129